VLRPDGKFVLEPQLWDSYSKAKRAHPTLKEKAAGIQMKPEEFGKVLQEIGFRHAGRLVVGDNGVQGEDFIVIWRTLSARLVLQGSKDLLTCI
jgi:hypothetical protein